VAAALPRLIAIVGPTASGKSALALRLAAEVGGEIVSCDSLQVYRGLDIGSAKATPQERRAVPHHLLDVVDLGQEFSAADYSRLARAAVADIARRGAVPIVAGGTGLYLRAFLDGLFEGPARNTRLRERFGAWAERFGDARLHRLLAGVDPPAAKRIPVRDRLRVVRALEVYWETGRPLSEHHRERPEPLAGFETQVLGLDPGVEGLRPAVEARTRAMMEQGLADEVRALLQDGHAPELRPLRAIGYRQAIEVVAGRMTPEEAERSIVADTLRFAKRQRTWFRHQLEAQWHASPERALAAGRQWLANSLTERRK
jgi:tRNA dimethylallyltransferase